MSGDPLVWSVDRSWGNVKATIDGDMYRSDYRRFHVDRGDSTAKCSKRILLNSLVGDVPERASAMRREDVCRRCVPVMPATTPKEGTTHE